MQEAALKVIWTGRLPHKAGSTAARGQALHLAVTAPCSCCWNTGCRLKPCSLSALPHNAALVRQLC